MALKDATEQFRPGEIKQIRTGKNVSDETRRKLFALLQVTTGEFIVEYQRPVELKRLRVGEAMGMFAFRYSLCLMIYYLRRVRVGGMKGRSLEKRMNDVVDMQIAALGTFFNGVLSRDSHLQMISDGLDGSRAATVASWAKTTPLHDADGIRRPANKRVRLAIASSTPWRPRPS